MLFIYLSIFVFIFQKCHIPFKKKKKKKKKKANTPYPKIPYTSLEFVQGTVNCIAIPWFGKRCAYNGMIFSKGLKGKARIPTDDLIPTNTVCVMTGSDRIGPNYRIGPIFYIFSSFLLSFSSLFLYFFSFRFFFHQLKNQLAIVDG